MKLKLNSKDFTHICDKSVYNYNFYIYKKSTFHPTVVLEICHEDYDYFEFWVVNDKFEKCEFLGCSEEGLKDDCEIDFKQQYT